MSSAELQTTKHGTIEASRATAVSRVVRGAKLGIAGIGAYALGAIASVNGLLLPGYLVAIGGLFAFSAGLVSIGAASRHLLRFGRLRGTVPLVALGGLGASLALRSATSLAATLDWIGFGVFLPIDRLAAIAGAGFAAILVIHTLFFVLRWVTSKARDPMVLA